MICGFPPPVDMGERFKVRVVPNAPKSACAGAYGEGVKIKVAAQAMDGKANAELVKFLSKKLGVGRGQIRIVCGETARDKLIEADAESCLARLLEG